MQENKRTALVLGGAGIIGVPVVAQLARRGEYEVHSISLHEAADPGLPDSVHQHTVDRNSAQYRSLARKLNKEVGHWDVVIDLVAFDSSSARETHSLLSESSKHFITVSTTLVYDRSLRHDAPISERCPLARRGQLGGYVDGKLKVEGFWQSIDDAAWTLLRPYHVLGAHSLLGCLPEHNRDPKLLQRLAAGHALRLCNGGDVIMNYVHPDDIAVAIARMAGNPKTFRQAYNLVNPAHIVVRDYYSEVARQAQATLRVESIPIQRIWEEMKGWEMTTLPHVYDMGKMRNDIGYVPNTPLSKGIEDAIAFRPRAQTDVERIPVHQRMNKLPRPHKIEWLTDGGTATHRGAPAYAPRNTA